MTRISTAEYPGDRVGRTPGEKDEKEKSIDNLTRAIQENWGVEESRPETRTRKPPKKKVISLRRLWDNRTQRRYDTPAGRKRGR